MLLGARNVSTFYGQIQALANVHLQVGEGEIVAIIGANGAGKTTLRFCFGFRFGLSSIPQDTSLSAVYTLSEMFGSS